MAQMLAPEVRSQFAQRLKSLRTQRGFDRARYFAKSLGIEENRYTRYERAEVEPSLTLIHKMCETLRVSPNELLGFADLRHLRAASGLCRGVAGGNRRAGRRQGADPVSSLAWNLAAEAVAIRHEHGARSKAPADPLAMLRETGALFQQSAERAVRDGGRDPQRCCPEGRRRQAQGRARRAHPGLHRERQRRAPPGGRAERFTCGSRRPSPCRPRR